MAQIINIQVARQAKEAQRVVATPKRKAKASGRLSLAGSINRDAVRQRAKAAL